MTKSVSIAWMKAHLAQVVGEVQHRKTQVVIEKHGKPVAMLVPVSAERPPGLGSWFGAFDDVPDFPRELDRIVAGRRKDKRRAIPRLGRR